MSAIEFNRALDDAEEALARASKVLLHVTPAVDFGDDRNLQRIRQIRLDIEDIRDSVESFGLRREAS